jgi:hypothetical protein
MDADWFIYIEIKSQFFGLIFGKRAKAAIVLRRGGAAWIEVGKSSEEVPHILSMSSSAIQNGR